MKTLESLSLKNMGVISKSKLSMVYGGAGPTKGGSTTKGEGTCDELTVCWTSDCTDSYGTETYGTTCDNCG
jgi:hypothetical protein